MATPTDPTFGAGFDADAFRSAITSTMEMGMPTDAADQATFFWNEVGTYDPGSPDTNTPYDLTATPYAITQQANTVTIPVAVEFTPRASLGSGLPVGDVESPRAVLTVLDTYYSQVEGADGVTFSGSDYDIDFVEPVIGLFTVNIYRIHVSALDEAA